MISGSDSQRSLQWFRSRMGCFTGSRVAELMREVRRKDKPFSETARTYIYQVAAERLFCPAFLDDDDIFRDYIEQSSFTSKAMRWGVDMENQARQLYARLAADDGVTLEEVSSCRHDTIPFFAASPDAIVRDGGKVRCIEIKCPNLATHMRYVAEIHDAPSLKAVRPEYYWQVMAEMACTGAESADFVSYCPWLTRPIHIARVERSDDDIALLEQRVRLANEAVDAINNPQPAKPIAYVPRITLGLVRPRKAQ